MWRNTGYSGKFVGVDYRALFPFMLFLVHMRLWTFITAVAIGLILAVIERFGYSVPVALRALRVWLAGPIKVSVAWRRAPSPKHKLEH